MYILYHEPYSQHARRVVALMEEAKLPYELKHVDLMSGAHRREEFLAVNPNGQVPTLLDGETKIHESNAILRYLCFKHDLREWYPDDLKQRAAVEQWLDWNQCRLSPVVVAIVLNTVFLGEAGDHEAAAKGREQLVELAAILENALRDGEFLAGATPSIADLSVASNLFQLSLAQAEPRTPNIATWYDRIAAMPGFQRSLPNRS